MVFLQLKGRVVRRLSVDPEDLLHWMLDKVIRRWRAVHQVRNLRVDTLLAALAIRNRHIRARMGDSRPLLLMAQASGKVRDAGHEDEADDPGHPEPCNHRKESLQAFDLDLQELSTYTRSRRLEQ